MSADIITRIRQHFPQIASRMDMLPSELAPGWLKRAAAQNIGLADFGPDFFEDALERLCLSANTDANLNPLGRMILAQTIITMLENRALMQNARSTHAAELQSDLIAPIIVTGLPRTGTTALHRLLASDPAHAALPYWQLNRPMPRGPDDSQDRRRAEVEEQIALRSKITPELDGIHLIRADVPEECMWVTATSMHSRLFWNLAPVYGFMEWYNTADRSEKYAEYAQWLHWFQAHYPGKRLVLKAPDHVDGLDALMRALPNAIIVQTHRAIDEQVASYLSLGRATRRLAVQALDPEREVGAVLALTESSIRRNLDDREKHQGRIIDIRYDDLIADPIATVERLYAQADLRLDAEARAALSRHQKTNRKGQHGGHSYGLSEFGLTSEGLRTRFAGYENRFGLATT